MIVFYVVTLVVLVVSCYVYFPIAKRLNMLAGVNHRSSHMKPVITGAGFIYFFSYIAYAIMLLYNNEPCPWLLFAGIIMLAIISFIDDIKEVWFLPRLIIQFIAAFLLILQVIFNEPAIGLAASVVQWLAIFSCLFFVVAMVNFYNFMDGLNGMMGCLTLAILANLWFTNEYLYGTNFIDSEILYFTLLPNLLFLFFNFRKQPICFSGDVGSVVLGLVIVFCVAQLILSSSHVLYILFFGVILIEAGLTLLQRLFAGENVFKPHRIFVFQLLANEKNKSHLLISFIYGAVQFALGFMVCTMEYANIDRLYQHFIMWPIMIILSVAYLLLKRQLLGGHLLDLKKNKVKA